MKGQPKRGPTERTPKGFEVPIPKREDFLRNLKKIAKPKGSATRRPKQ